MLISLQVLWLLAVGTFCLTKPRAIQERLVEWWPVGGKTRSTGYFSDYLSRYFSRYPTYFASASCTRDIRMCGIAAYLMIAILCVVFLMLHGFA